MESKAIWDILGLNCFWSLFFPLWSEVNHTALWSTMKVGKCSALDNVFGETASKPVLVRWCDVLVFTILVSFLVRKTHKDKLFVTDFHMCVWTGLPRLDGDGLWWPQTLSLLWPQVHACLLLCGFNGIRRPRKTAESLDSAAWARQASLIGVEMGGRETGFH